MSICEMPLQQLQWHLYPEISMCLDGMNPVPQLRSGIGDYSQQLVPISEAGEAAVERGWGGGLLNQEPRVEVCRALLNCR